MELSVAGPLSSKRAHTQMEILEYYKMWRVPSFFSYLIILILWRFIPLHILWSHLSLHCPQWTGALRYFLFSTVTAGHNRIL